MTKTLTKTLTLFAFAAGFALAGLAGPAGAVVPHKVTCSDGTVIEIGDTENPSLACLTSGHGTSLPGKARNKKALAAPQAKQSPEARRYENLAKRYRPRTAEQKRLVKQYMRLPAHQRDGFVLTAQGQSTTGGIDVPFEYLAYSACFYGGWAGGGDVVEVGDECKAEWID